MVLQAFQWGQGGQKLSPQQVAEQRKVAQALAARGGAPRNVGQGLNRIGEALMYRSLTGRANEAEQMGREQAGEAFDTLVASGGMREGGPSMDEIFGFIGNEWATPQQSAVAEALLNQQMQRQDPMYQTELELMNAELDAARNPVPETPDVETFYDPETGSPYKAQWNPQTGSWDQVGGTEAQGQPDFSSVTLELPDGSQRSFNTSDPAQYEAANQLMSQGAVEVPSSLVDINMGEQNEVPSWVGAVGEQVGKDYSSMVAAGSAAPRRLSQIDQLESLLAETPSGLAGQATVIAGNMGIDLGEGTSNAQAAQALINQLVPSSRPEGSGPMSDADLAMFRQSWPQIINTPEGNQMVIDTIRSINMYDYQLGQIVRDGAAAVAQASDADERRMLEQQMEERINALQNPLEGFNDRISPFMGGDRSSQGNGQQTAPSDDSGYSEGTIIENDQGQRMVLRNGQWVEAM